MKYIFNFIEVIVIKYVVSILFRKDYTMKKKYKTANILKCIHDKYIEEQLQD